MSGSTHTGNAMLSASSSGARVRPELPERQDGPESRGGGNAEVQLSVCIATRNRGAFIAETISSITAQCASGIEILVLDGASTDNTEEVVRGLALVTPNLRYFRKDANGGVDRDYDEVVGHATGKYCWLMSDDDLVMPGAVAEVLSAIDRGFSLIVVNSEVRTFDFAVLLDPNRLRIQADRVYSKDEFDKFFRENVAYLTYIGAVVIRREIWQSRRREPYYGSYFIHVGVIFQAELPGDSLVIARPSISIRFGNTQWRPKEFEIRMVRWTELLWSLPSISHTTKRAICPQAPWTSIKSLMFYRAKGTYCIDDYRKWIEPRAEAVWDRLKAISIARFPGPIANLIGLVVCSFNYRDSNIHFLDMKVSRFYFRNWVKSLMPGHRNRS